MSMTEAQIPTNAFRWLTARRQWVAWRTMQRDGGKATKPPVNPHTGRDADVTDPTTWGSYVEALERHYTDGLPGIGYVLSGDDGLAGVDLDGCLDAGGNLAPWAAAIVTALDSYTELSPSGRGLHILAWGQLPPGRRKKGPIEMYDGARYLTFTGKVYGDYWSLYERSSELAAMHGQHLGAEAAATERAPAPAPAASLADLAILDKLFKSRAGQRVAALWVGNTAGYSSPSEADMALAVHLAFYTQDAGQLRRLMAMSGLGAREKWQREDYAAATIQRAIDSRQGTYDPAWRPR